MNINLTTERTSMAKSSRKISYQVEIVTNGTVHIFRRIYAIRGERAFYVKTYRTTANRCAQIAAIMAERANWKLLNTGGTMAAVYFKGGK